MMSRHQLLLNIIRQSKRKAIFANQSPNNASRFARSMMVSFHVTALGGPLQTHYGRHARDNVDFGNAVRHQAHLAVAADC